MGFNSGFKGLNIGMGHIFVATFVGWLCSLWARHWSQRNGWASTVLCGTQELIAKEELSNEHT